MSDLQYHVALRINEEREGAGMSKCELAKLSGISRRCLIHLENAEYMPSLHHLALIAEVLAVPVSTFLEGAPQHE